VIVVLLLVFGGIAAVLVFLIKNKKINLNIKLPLKAERIKADDGDDI